MVLEAFEAGADFVFSMLSRIWSIYQAGGIFAVPVVLWILDRVFHIFDVLKP